MKNETFDIGDAVRKLPWASRRCLGIFLSAVAGTYLTFLIEVILGNPPALFGEVVNVILTVVPLLFVGAVTLLTRKVIWIHLAFAALGFAYIVFATRFACGVSLALIRQYIAYTLPFLLNGFFLVSWFKYSEDYRFSQQPN